MSDSRCCVLCVDDHHDTSEMLQLLLSEENYEVHTAATMEEACELAAKQRDQRQALPAAGAQQLVRECKSPYSRVECTHKVLHGFAGFQRVGGHCRDGGEHVLDAMVELRNQHPLMVFGAPAFGNVNINPDHSLRLLTSIVRREAA